MTQTQYITIPSTRQGNTSKDAFIGFHIHVLFKDWSSLNEDYWSQDPATQVIQRYEELVARDDIRTVRLIRRNRVIKFHDADSAKGNAPLGSNKGFSLLK